MTKEEAIKRLESIKETYETFAGGLDDIHLDIVAHLKYGSKPMTNREKIFEDFGINLELSCLCTSDEVEDKCIKNGDCFGCNKWLNAPFKERKNMIEEYDFNDFEDKINKIYENLEREREQHLAEIIERYDFMVGSAELKEKLESILPDGANIVYSKYVESPTTIFAIKKIDFLDLLKIKED